MKPEIVYANILGRTMRCEVIPGNRCAFCYDGEQGKHGEVKREYSTGLQAMVPVCRYHASFDGMIDSTKPESCPACQGRKVIIPMGYQGEATDCPVCTKTN
jgi:hypothetical protein